MLLLGSRYAHEAIDTALLTIIRGTVGVRVIVTGGSPASFHQRSQRFMDSGTGRRLVLRVACVVCSVKFNVLEPDNTCQSLLGAQTRRCGVCPRIRRRVEG